MVEFSSDAASVQGISTNINIPAIAGGTSVADGLTAHFTGTTYVDYSTESGTFVVNPMTAKFGLLTQIKYPDATASRPSGPATDATHSDGAP